MKFKVIDLFAGAGGFSLGFHNAGFEIVASIELNEKFCKTHSLNFPSCKSIYGDIKNWPPKKFSEATKIFQGDIDVIIGGPPCQTFSNIGTPKLKSLHGTKSNEDPRNYLYKDFFDYVNFFKPKAFVMENVPSMKSKYKGHLFQNILDKIKSIGYHPHSSILNAVNYGVPQTRKRLFIVGFKDDVKFSFPKETHYSPDATEIEKINKKKFNTVQDALSDLPKIFDGIRAGYLPYSSKFPLSEFQKIIRNGDKQVGNNVCRVSNIRAKKVFEYMSQGDKYMDLPPKVRQILPFREDIFHDRLKRLSNDQPSWTVIAHIGMDGYMYIHPTETRTLSVREAARIQSFDDKFEFFGNMREQYVQVGNSVPPLLAKALAENLKLYIK